MGFKRPRVRISTLGPKRSVSLETGRFSYAVCCLFYWDFVSVATGLLLKVICKRGYFSKKEGGRKAGANLPPLYLLLRPSVSKRLLAVGNTLVYCKETGAQQAEKPRCLGMLTVFR